MVKPEWGRRRVCVKCGTKFYDLRRDPAKCPSCGVIAETVTPRATSAERKAVPMPGAVKTSQEAEIFEDEELEVVDLDTDIDDADLDADELPDDPAEMPV